MITEVSNTQRPQAVNVRLPGDVNQKPVEPSGGSPPTKEKEGQDIELLKDVLGVAQQHFQLNDIDLQFNVHEGTGRIKVTVTDKETGELVREIPPQKVLDLMEKIDEMMGVFFDRKA